MNRIKSLLKSHFMSDDGCTAALIWTGTLFLLLAAMALSMTIGAWDIPIKTVAMDIWNRITGGSAGTALSPAMTTTLYHIRLPRILLVLIVGMALSGSGVSLQAVFRNPLVDPFILGISAGAAMGAALSLAFLPTVPVQAAAFGFGLLAVFLALFFAGGQQETPIVSTILAGIVVSSFFSAGLSIIQFLVDPDRLSSIVFWLMGSFGLASWKTLLSVAPAIVAGLAALFVLSWRMNILSLGDEESRALGLSARHYRFGIVVIASFLTASAVSVCGIIGWVGLIVPHMARFVVGPDHRKLMPFSVIMGGVFLLLADNLCRGWTDFEIPIGIVTSLCGAPLFMVLLRNQKEAWGH